MGQRSLLFHPPTEDCPYLCISSVPFNDYSLQMSTNTNINNELSKENNNNSKDSEGTEEEEKENSNIISSWTELPTSSLYSLKIDNITDSTVIISIETHHYNNNNEVSEYYPFGKRTCVTPDVDYNLNSVEDSFIKGLLDVLYNSVKVRVLNLPIATE